MVLKVPLDSSSLNYLAGSLCGWSRKRQKRCPELPVERTEQYSPGLTEPPVTNKGARAPPDLPGPLCLPPPPKGRHQRPTSQDRGAWLPLQFRGPTPLPPPPRQPREALRRWPSPRKREPQRPPPAHTGQPDEACPKWGGEGRETGGAGRGHGLEGPPGLADAALADDEYLQSRQNVLVHLDHPEKTAARIHPNRSDASSTLTQPATSSAHASLLQPFPLKGEHRNAHAPPRACPSLFVTPPLSQVFP